MIHGPYNVEEFNFCKSIVVLEHSQFPHMCFY
jgi:hypothetical protein